MVNGLYLSGTALCRKKFTGDDWKLPEIQERYNGYFSPYLQRKVDQLRRERELDTQLNKLSIMSSNDTSISEKRLSCLSSDESEPYSPSNESASPNATLGVKTIPRPACAESP